MLNLNKFASTTIIVAGIILLLVFGKDLIIPFVLALLVWFVIKGINDALCKINWIKQNLSYNILTLISSAIIVLLLMVFGKMLAANINNIITEIPKYEANVEHWIDDFPFRTELEQWVNLEDVLSQIQFSEIVKSLANAMSSLIGNAVLILIYLIFIILESRRFSDKIAAFAKSSKDPKKYKVLIAKIGDIISEYLGLKIIVSLSTGVLSYIILLIVGVDAALFWAVIIFVFNFIPTIGSIIGTLFPAAFALFQFGSLEAFLYVLIPVGVVQVVIGNFIEPRLMGNSLNISALVVLISLSLWGAIWGITGMLLCVPLTVIIVNVLYQFEGTKRIAKLLSN